MASHAVTFWDIIRCKMVIPARNTSAGEWGCRRCMLWQVAYLTNQLKGPVELSTPLGARAAKERMCMMRIGNTLPFCWC